MVELVIDFFSRVIHFFYIITETVGFPNYGLAILLFTIVVKLILFPLTKKQMDSMAKMQAIQPEIQRLQEAQKKGKKDSQKMQQEMMGVYKEHGVNPIAGCLPLLIQMPILISLFWTLNNLFDPVNHPEFVNMDKAEFLWISNLGAADPFILPVLVAIATFGQQKIMMGSSPATGSAAQTQKMMLYFMPIFIGFISRNFPAGLALYWVFFSLSGTIEGFIIRRQREAGKIKEEKKGDDE